MVALAEKSRPVPARRFPFDGKKFGISFNLYSMRKPQRIDGEGKNPTAAVFALLNYRTASWWNQPRLFERIITLEGTEKGWTVINRAKSINGGFTEANNMFINNANNPHSAVTELARSRSSKRCNGGQHNTSMVLKGLQSGQRPESKGRIAF